MGHFPKDAVSYKQGTFSKSVSKSCLRKLSSAWSRDLYEGDSRNSVQADRYNSGIPGVEHIVATINSAGKRDRICVLFSSESDKLLVTNRPKAAAEGSGLRPLSYPRNGRGPLPKAAARAPFGFAVPQKVEVRVAQFHS